jgi:hypothetical protein
VVKQVTKMLSTSAKGAQPRGEEAQRVLATFAASLKNPTLVRGAAAAVGVHAATVVSCRALREPRRPPGPAAARQASPLTPLAVFAPCLRTVQETPPSIEDMLSWNTLTPHYEEDVIYALNSVSVAKHFGMDAVAARVGSAAWQGSTLRLWDFGAGWCACMCLFSETNHAAWVHE